MDYPARKRKSRSKSPDVDVDRGELRLARYSAPLGEEMPWRLATADLPELAGDCGGWRPERGRLH
jgi:hypothetical protein